MKYTKDIASIQHLLPDFIEETGLKVNLDFLVSKMQATLSNRFVTITNEENTCVLWGNLNTTMLTNENVFFISIIFVQKDQRRKGLASQMVEKLKQFCEVNSATSIIMNSGHGASGLANKLGEPDEHHYRISV